MKLVYVVVAAALLAASPVKAQVVDMSTITCADFSGRPAAADEVMGSSNDNNDK
jgi:transketolase C-terminal domain/subunit